MKLSRDGWLGVGILLALVLVVILAALQQNNTPSIPYLSTSSSPDGVLALKLWLDSLGYHTGEISQANFSPSRDVKFTFILQPIVPVSEGEWKLLDEWVAKGGILILAGDNAVSDNAMEHYKFSVAYLPQEVSELTMPAPIFKSPLITSKIEVKTNFGIKTPRTDFTPLLFAEDMPVIVTFDQGMGHVILSSTPYIFSNLALKNDTLAALVLNFISFEEKKGGVWFDEWHHGFQAESIVGPSQWLQSTPGGHAILFIIGVIFISLFLQGRAFGRPVPLSHELKRRGPLEHVTAVANLNYKAGHRNEVLKQYHQRLKRQLGHRYRLDPSLTDAEYVDQLSKYNASIDSDSLLNLLKRLSQENISESELLKLASEAALWIGK